VGIVTDGNGRWAKAPNLPRIKGDARTEASLFDVIEGPSRSREIPLGVRLFHQELEPFAERGWLADGLSPAM
jgi:undecaprenyl pyrophosphate synthase